MSPFPPPFRPPRLYVRRRGGGEKSPTFKVSY